MTPERKLPPATDPVGLAKFLNERRGEVFPFNDMMKAAFPQDRLSGCVGLDEAPPEETPQQAASRLREMIRKRVGRKAYTAEVDRLAARGEEFNRQVVAAMDALAPTKPRFSTSLKQQAAYHRATRFRQPK